jgi:hypothetical protein
VPSIYSFEGAKNIIEKFLKHPIISYILNLKLMFDQISTSNFIGILSIAIVLIYLSIKIIKSTNSEEKFTVMQTYWFIFIFLSLEFF